MAVIQVLMHRDKNSLQMNTDPGTAPAGRCKKYFLKRLSTIGVYPRLSVVKAVCNE